MIDYNKVLKKHEGLISAYARIYGNGDYTDFKQDLMILLWDYIERKYDSRIGSIDVFIGSNLKYLALNMLDKRRRNKQLVFENSFSRLEDCLYYIRNYSANSNLMYVIENCLNDIQKKIVYVLDSQGTGDSVSYKKVAEILGIKQRMLYYYLSQIREIMEKYVKYDVK